MLISLQRRAGAEERKRKQEEGGGDVEKVREPSKRVKKNTAADALTPATSPPSSSPPKGLDVCLPLPFLLLLSPPLSVGEKENA